MCFAQISKRLQGEISFYAREGKFNKIFNIEIYIKNLKKVYALPSLLGRYLLVEFENRTTQVHTDRHAASSIINNAWHIYE